MREPLYAEGISNTCSAPLRTTSSFNILSENSDILHGAPYEGFLRTAHASPYGYFWKTDSNSARTRTRTHTHTHSHLVLKCDHRSPWGGETVLPPHSQLQRRIEHCCTLHRTHLCAHRQHPTHFLAHGDRESGDRTPHSISERQSALSASTGSQQSSYRRHAGLRFRTAITNRSEHRPFFTNGVRARPLTHVFSWAFMNSRQQIGTMVNISDCPRGQINTL